MHRRAAEQPGTAARRIRGPVRQGQMPQRGSLVACVSSLGLFAAWLTGGCLEVASPTVHAQAEPHDVVVSDGMQLQEACVPTGVERCFDALDDNCNGVIDEGCGLRTGVLQFAIAWSEPAVDVDLQVTGPDGELARVDEPTPAGLIKDRDCPGSDEPCRGQNVENVYLAEGSPKRGRYRVAIRLEDVAGVSEPIRVRLSARIGQRHFTTVVELMERREQREFSFTL